ncbi:hypothetical protein DKX38_015807 [Salix brachista]|uniref:HD domain-containing protein n=1 Tax=Salix brachista TaxID=2182728 RepID=A0A5N5L689_9ROSI|nr:hypothetical protein DKX38_015807 [Salix brachista]
MISFPTKLQCNRCLKISIVHDIAEGQKSKTYKMKLQSHNSPQRYPSLHLTKWEKSPTTTTALIGDSIPSIVGDVTPSDGVPKQEKISALRFLEPDIFIFSDEEIKELWAEHENNDSLEANLVKDFDKHLNMKWEVYLRSFSWNFLIRCHYVFTEHGKVLGEFFLSTAGKFQTEIGKSWAAEISSTRNSILTKKQN